MSNWKENISKGEFEVDNITTRTGDFYRVKEPLGVSICNVTTRNQEQALANAQLIAEAFNVFNETGKTPRELVEANKDFLKTLKQLSSTTLDEGQKRWIDEQINKQK
tara:strand:+ start:6096 stop:6416 length:321 start_codon:yes stop_codon:yes gene_type:complete